MPQQHQQYVRMGRWSYGDFRYYERMSRSRTKPPQSQPTIPCAHENKIFVECISAQPSDVASCQYYYDNLVQCKQQRATPCAQQNEAFTDCISTSKDNVASCQFYFDALSHCKQQSANP